MITLVSCEFVQVFLKENVWSRSREFYVCSTEYSGKPRAASNPLNLKMKSGLYREPRILGTEFNKLVQALKDGRVGGDVESRANVRYLGLDLHATYLP